MVAESQPTTALEFERQYDKQDKFGIELIDGEVVVSPEPLPQHQRIVARLWSQLDAEARRQNLGEWFLPINLRISAYSVLQPDLSFFPADAIPDGKTASVAERPSIVIEVMSPSSRNRDRLRKRVRYADRGIPEYWIVDPEAKTITIHLLDGQGNYIDSGTLEGRIASGIFSGLLLDLLWVFGSS